MTASTAILGLLPILLLRLYGTEIERPLAVVMTGGLITSTIFTLLSRGPVGMPRRRGGDDGGDDDCDRDDERCCCRCSC